MAVRVKSYTRNGRVVKGHTRSSLLRKYKAAHAEYSKHYAGGNYGSYAQRDHAKAAGHKADALAKKINRKVKKGSKIFKRKWNLVHTMHILDRHK